MGVIVPEAGAKSLQWQAGWTIINAVRTRGLKITLLAGLCAVLVAGTAAWNWREIIYRLRIWPRPAAGFTFVDDETGIEVQVHVQFFLNCVRSDPPPSIGDLLQLEVPLDDSIPQSSP